MRMRLFVVVAARAAEEEPNFLSVFARHVFSYGFVPIVTQITLGSSGGSGGDRLVNRGCKFAELDQSNPLKCWDLNASHKVIALGSKGVAPARARLFVERVIPSGRFGFLSFPCYFRQCLDCAIEGPAGPRAHAAETAGPYNFQHRHLTGLGPERRVGVLVLGVIPIGAGLYQKR